MDRTFQLTDEYGMFTEYKGFNKQFQPTHLVDRVVLVLVEGELEAFALDDSRSSVPELLRYLADNDRYDERTVVLGHYRRGD